MWKQEKKSQDCVQGKKKKILVNSDWPSPQYTLWLIALFLFLWEEGTKLRLEPLINIREPIY